MPTPAVSVFPDAQTLCQEALRLIVSRVAESEGRSGNGATVSLALSGGSTPKTLYQMLASQHPDLVKQRLHFYFGDVRMVPNDSADSNYKMVQDAMLHILNAEEQKERVFAIQTEGGVTAEEAAKAYAETLQTTLPLEDGTSTPQFDIVLLGVGPDGHTASLFPTTAASTEVERLVVPCMPNIGVTPYVERVTITRRVIQAAAMVVVLATGADKNWVLKGILSEDEASLEKVPVARLVRECRGKVLLLVDKAMAGGESKI